MTTDGYLSLSLPDGPLVLGLSRLRLSHGGITADGTRTLGRGDRLTVPAGRYPIALLGEDFQPVLRADITIEATSTAYFPEDSPDSIAPVTFTLTMRWVVRGP